MTVNEPSPVGRAPPSGAAQGPKHEGARATETSFAARRAGGMEPTFARYFGPRMIRPDMYRASTQ